MNLEGLINFVESGAAKALLDGKLIRRIGKITYYSIKSNLPFNTMTKDDKWVISNQLEPYTLKTVSDLIGKTLIREDGRTILVSYVGRHGILSITGNRLDYKELLRFWGV